MRSFISLRISLTLRESVFILEKLSSKLMLMMSVFHRAASKEEILASKVTVASLFFKNVFGTQAQKALTVFVALRLVSGYRM